MKTWLAAALTGAAMFLAQPALADTTGPAGSSAPIENRQPSLVLTQFVAKNGPFPARDCPECTAGNTLGMIHTFAGNFAPFGNPAAQAQSQMIADNTALFSLYGTTYGGNGQTTYDLPDLTGRVAVGPGQGPGLSPYSLGQEGGAAQNVMSLSQLPVHDHDLPGGGMTGPAGGGQPLDNVQPYLGMNYQIAVNGIFPSDGNSSGDVFIGQIGMFGGNFATNGYLPADGRLLSISEYDSLFNIIGTTYGGDGQTNFALPDLRGRTPVGYGGLYSLADAFGDESTFLSEANLPTHVHALDSGFTGPAGLGQPFSNVQPSLALNYLIATEGIFPSQTGDGGVPSELGDQFIGEVILSASTITPRGFAQARGQLLSISQNTALFSILGTTYGGDGRVTFALPDLRNRSVIGSGQGFTVGSVFGETTHSLTNAEMATHVHFVPDVADVPEPATWALMIAGFGLAGTALRRRRLAA